LSKYKIYATQNETLQKLTWDQGKRFALTETHTDVLRYRQNTRMWANAQRAGRPAEYRCRPPFNAAKFG